MLEICILWICKSQRRSICSKKRAPFENVRYVCYKKLVVKLQIPKSRSSLLENSINPLAILIRNLIPLGTGRSKTSSRWMYSILNTKHMEYVNRVSWVRFLNVCARVTSISTSTTTMTRYKSIVWSWQKQYCVFDYVSRDLNGDGREDGTNRWERCRKGNNFRRCSRSAQPVRFTASATIRITRIMNSFWWFDAKNSSRTCTSQIVGKCALCVSVCVCAMRANDFYLHIEARIAHPSQTAVAVNERVRKRVYY